jgi:hypothetical protein
MPRSEDDDAPPVLRRAKAAGIDQAEGGLVAQGCQTLQDALHCVLRCTQ